MTDTEESRKHPRPPMLREIGELRAQIETVLSEAEALTTTAPTKENRRRAYRLRRTLSQIVELSDRQFIRCMSVPRNQRALGEIIENPYSDSTRHLAMLEAWLEQRRVRADRMRIRQLEEQLAAKSADSITEEGQEHFKEESSWNMWGAWIALAVATLALGGAFWFTLCFPGEAPEGWEAVRVYSAKATGLLLLVAVAIAASKVFFASMHNAVVNRQRENAMKSFKDFYNTASGDEQQGKVVDVAAKLIFSPIPTGLTKVGASDLTVISGLVKDMAKVKAP